MKKIIEYTKYEFGRIHRDIDIMLILLAAPLFYAIFYGSIYMNKLETEVPIAVIDHDHSELSEKIIYDLNADPTLRIVSENEDILTAKMRFFNEKIYGIVEIDGNLSKNIKKGERGNIALYLNTTRFLVANDINKAVHEVVAKYNYGIRLKYTATRTENSRLAKEQIIPVNADIRPVFNPVESYGDFLIPGVLILILQQTLLIALGESTSEDKKLFLSAKNISSFNLQLVGKIGIYILAFGAYAIIFYGLLLKLFGMEFSGSVIAGTILTFIFLINVALTAVAVGSFFSSKRNVLIVLAFTSYPFFLLSGFSWLQGSMPLIIKWLSYLIPSTPYLLGMSKVISSGADFQNVFGEFIILIFQLIIFLVVVNTINYFKQKKEVKNEKAVC